MGSRVLLLEADLRRPTIALQLDVSSGPGVADVLIGAVSFMDDHPLVRYVDGPAGRRARLVGLWSACGYLLSWSHRAHPEETNCRHK
jgi:hypothetical protein